MPGATRTKRSSKSTVDVPIAQEQKQTSENLSEAPRRKSQRLSREFEKKKSITSSFEGLLVERNGKTQRQISNEVFQDCEKELAKSRRGSARGKSPCKDFTQFLLEDLEDVSAGKEGIVEEVVESAVAQQNFLSHSMEYDCTIMHTGTLLEWSGVSRLKVQNGGSTLRMWRLSATSPSASSEYCYVFGINRGGWKYVTLTGAGQPFRFMSAASHPTDIDMDIGEETSDPRAFYWRRSGSDGYLIPASDESLAAKVNSNTNQVFADTHGATSDLWALNY